MKAKDYKGAFQSDKEYKFHPFAEVHNLWNSDRELEATSGRIALQGQRVPIILVEHDGEDMIVDGRRRYLAITKGKACQKAGIKPWYIKFTGDEMELIEAIKDLNDYRRHSSPAQLMAAAERLLAVERKFAEARQVALAGRRHHEENGKDETKAEGKEAQEEEDEREQGKAAASVADRLGVSTRQVEKIASVIEKGSESLKNAIKNGELSGAAAYEINQLPADLQKEVVQKVKKEKASPRQAIKAAKRELEEVCDQLGNKVPGPMKFTFIAIKDLHQIKRSIGAAKAGLKKLLENEKAQVLPTAKAQAAIRQLEDVHCLIKECEAFTSCLNCNGKGCTKCSDRGWISRALFEMLPKEVREQVQADAKA
jgi:DNA-directed RNA polymerase subunit L